MASAPFRFSLHSLAAAAAACVLGLPAWAQQAAQTVEITGRTLQAAPGIGGFGELPLSRAPFAGTVLGGTALLDAGVERLSDITRLDASLSDAYNSDGYWSFLSVRGYTLDNRFNYRRDGLPINAETSIGMANKERIEVFKGTSGIQAGTSAPGGLVNFVVKRPDAAVRSASLEWREQGSIGVATDLSQRFGAHEAFGLRVNAAYDHLDPQVRSLEGHRRQLAVAGDWRIAPGTLVEAEFEHSRQSQPSVPGFSLLGDSLPSARRIDPRTNLNNQPWSLPVVMEGNTASLRLQQQLGSGWRFTAHGMTQHLSTDDRLAYPYGCSAEDRYDRYCSDGSFDLYDFRSDNERRRSDALDFSLAGSPVLAGLRHQFSTGVLFTRFKSRAQGQAYNYTGTGHIDGAAVTEPAPELTDENTERDERSTELYLRDMVQLSADWRLWAGLRHTRLHRDSVRTDGSRATGYGQSETLPWLAASWQWTPATVVYASWGQGLESDVVPNRSFYVNAGQALPALKSRQTELGIKHERDDVSASLVAFQIDRPRAADLCDADDQCLRRPDGSARHRGLEAALGWSHGPWQLRGSAMWLQARLRNSSDDSLNGNRPTNVPPRSFRLAGSYAPAALPGLQLQAGLVHEADKMVLDDNSIAIPGWTTVNLGARYVQRLSRSQLTWRVGVDNVGDKRAWRESPFQFGHAYLYPLSPRTFRASIQLDL
ncbi:TonB-dependent siderophore receptor [Aquincola tertiaricarbonis]|uniref:TonB-dependent siderophore receptor n=1 Tax=Aquincola tertiaricarbonis TaxID=391953 RepID=UPI0006990DC4|nr:TonB-dependent siderophore receptor [Aquincola tertiaricarbonis]